MYRYDDEEWENVVARDPEWDRAETDYLLSLCEQYDLRFLVIADRYEVRTRLQAGDACLHARVMCEVLAN